MATVTPLPGVDTAKAARAALARKRAAERIAAGYGLQPHAKANTLSRAPCPNRVAEPIAMWVRGGQWRTGYRYSTPDDEAVPAYRCPECWHALTEEEWERVV